MKRCPECRRDYDDDTLRFCLADGTNLVYGLSDDEPATALFTRIESQTEDQTRAVLKDLIEPANSIAVLPFTNISADSENEYFCDGLAEELLNALTKVENLQVAARTSAFSFKGKNAEVREIARLLRVRNVLEGSVRRSGNRLRVTVQLVNTSDGYHLWSERYDREVEDVFVIQDEITLAVVDALKINLLGDQKARLTKRSTSNTGAYEFYLQGHFYLSTRALNNVRKAIDCFTKAIDLDPKYAAAYAGLTYAYILLSSYGGEAPHTAMPKAREAGLKALSIDPGLAEAHVALSTVFLDYEYDFSKAEAGFKKALEINPNYATGHHLYGQMLYMVRRFDESLAEISRARELDPFSQIADAVYGACLFFGGHYEEAADHLERTVSDDAGLAPAHAFLAAIYQAKGNYQKCCEELAMYQEIIGKPDSANAIRQSYEGGKDSFLRGMVKEGLRVDLSWHHPAVFYTALGKKDKAIDELHAAYDDRKAYILLINVDPRLDPLRGEHRFQELLKKVGFPE